MNVQTIGRQAVIIGGSIAGLAAARVLADKFDQVVIIERDEQPTEIGPRKAVPQGYHAHALLKGGENALDALFPGLMQEVHDLGGLRVDFSKDVHWYHGGQWKMRYDSGFDAAVQSRPLLEHVIRSRVECLLNVTFIYGSEVETLTATTDQSRITGVVVRRMADRSEKIELESDLLIDASGRGSKMPQWLEALGYRAPSETRLKIGLSYSSRMYEAPEGGKPDWDVLIINPEAPHTTRAGYILAMEGGRYMATLAGYNFDPTPYHGDGFLDFARTLAQPDVYEALRTMTPVSEAKVCMVPQTVRRHYEKLSRMPAGVLVMGDAMCAFDPVFGQGMSAASLEALALQSLLENETAETLDTLGKRFQKRAAQVVEVPWMLASGEDLRFPKTEGYRSPILPFLHWYSNHIFALSATDREVFDTFRQVMHLLAGAEALFKPSIAFKVLRHALSRPSRQTVTVKRELRPAI